LGQIEYKNLNYKIFVMNIKKIPLKYIFLDWSHTLVKDLWRVAWTHNIIRNMIDEDPVTVSEFREVLKISTSAADNYNKWRIVDGTEEKSENLFKFLYENLYSTSNDIMEPELYEDSMSVISMIRDMGIEMIMVSSHPEDALKAEMKALGVSEYVTEIHGSVGDKGEKLIEIMSRLDINPREVAYVGDSIYDMMYAEAAGVVAIAKYYDGYSTKESMDEMIEAIRSRNKPHARVNTLTDLLNILEHDEDRHQVYLTLGYY